MATIIDLTSIHNFQTTTERTWNQSFLERHNLLGHIYRRTQDKTYYPYWKSQLNRNSVAKVELEKIGKDIQSEAITVFLLKGYSLMGEVYQDWGERYVADIDLLVSHEQLWKLTDILKMYGYTKRRQKKWLGNRYKHTYYKKTSDDIQLSIEIHTQLFWHQNLNISENHASSQVAGFCRLSYENQLIHLCGHIAFQNSYTKLHWLMDIFKYVERYKKKIQWDVFWKAADKANLYKSCYFTLFLCQKLGLNIQTILYKAKKKKKVSVYFLKKIVDYSYLYDPVAYPMKKVLVMFLIKDSLFDNFRYAYAWFKTFSRGPR